LVNSLNQTSSPPVLTNAATTGSCTKTKLMASSDSVYAMPQAHEPLKEPLRYADPVNNPSHYKMGEVEVIQVTEQLNFFRGNAVKYICRAGKKEDEIQDLEKAIWYLQRELKRLGHTPHRG